MKKHLIITFLLLSLIGKAQTENEIYIYLLQIGMEEPDIVLKQVLYESAHLTSDIYRENHNLFGMKLAKKRVTTALGEKRGHAYYSNWKKSIEDYKIWQNLYYKSGCYYQFLINSGYSTNPKYINTLKRINI